VNKTADSAVHTPGS